MKLLGRGKIIAILMLCILFLCACAEKEEILLVGGKCSVVQVDDWSRDDTVIKRVHIVLNECETVADAQKLAKEALNEYVATEKVNAITVVVHEKGTKTSGMEEYVVACTYAPNGNILLADKVETGDYTTFEYRFF